jgi:hypothetical protein
MTLVDLGMDVMASTSDDEEGVTAVSKIILDDLLLWYNDVAVITITVFVPWTFGYMFPLIVVYVTDDNP